MRPSLDENRDRTRGSPGDSLGEELFREEAKPATGSPGYEGEVLRISPAWARSVYWVLLGIVALLLLASIVARSREYASGPAVLRAEGETRLSTLLPGTVEEVAVRSGQRVQAGDVLVRFHSENERNVLSQLQTEFDLQLVRLLRDPGDESVRDAIVGVRGRLKLAQAQLAERTIRAPTDGWIQDVRIRPEQHLAAGEPIVGIASERERLSLVAFLPGEFRPLLEPGQDLRLIPAGYRHSRVELQLETVQEEVVGARAALNMLEPQRRDALSLAGPVVVVTATLPKSSFRADGEDRPFFGGMLGTVEVCVGDRPILVSLVPGAQALYERLQR